MFLSFTHTYNMERSNSFRISLKKKKERTEKKEKKKPQDFLPQYGLHIRFFKGKGRVFG
jgi:predicted ATPase